MKRNYKILVSSLKLTIVIVAIALGVPFTIGLFKAGFLETSVLSQFNFYQNLMIFLFGIWAIVLLEFFTTKDDELYGDGTGFSSIGEKPALNFFKRFTVPQLTIIFIIFYLLIGLWSISTVGQQTSYTGVGTLQTQQFSASDNIIYGTALIPIPENLSAAFVICLFLYLLRLFARKYKIDSKLFILIAILGITLIVGIAGGVWHETTYKDSEVALTTTVGFWMLGGLLTAITGIFPVFWMQHSLNNLIYDLSKLFIVEAIKTYIIIGIIVFTLLYILIYRKRIFGDKRLLLDKKIEKESL